MCEASENVSKPFDFFYGGHTFIRRNVIRSIFDYCSSPDYSLLILRLMIWKYITRFKGEDRLTEAPKLWKRSKRAVRELDEDFKRQAFTFLQNRLLERDLVYDDRDSICRVPRLPFYTLCTKGGNCCEFLLCLVGCLQIVRENRFTFRINQRRIAKRFNQDHGAVSRAVGKLIKRGIIVRVWKDRDLNNPGRLYTFNCSKIRKDELYAK